MASLTDPDSNRAIAGAVAYVLGGQADYYRNLVIVYETTDDSVGALSFACCTEHTLKLLALASVVVIEDPAAPFGETCRG
jgi:hypothetical protein